MRIMPTITQQLTTQMANKDKPVISEQTQQEALAIAKATQKPGQTKEQTRLIAQGIEKGIAHYKKQHKAKARAADKARKQQRKAKQAQPEHPAETSTTQPNNRLNTLLPWGLLAISWLGFILYLL